jgi:2-polyprenyl-6-methoxyphenol hydroxylase-like FAD-dependent oxidoreductase
VKALVVGAGVAGLGCALSLRAGGIEATVLEQASELREVGAGLGLASNGVEVLDRLGVDEELRAHSFKARRVLLRRRDGKVLSSVDLAERRPMLGVHRADLQSVLADAVGGDALRLGARVAAVAQSENRAWVELETGDVEEADVVIGADGIRSTVRGTAVDPQLPVFAGYVGWRAVTHFSHPALAETFSETWGCGYRFGLVPIGGGRLYWFVSETAAEPVEATLRRPKDEFLRIVAGWHDPIGAAVSATAEDAIEGLGIYYLPPLAGWSSGRITLVGDAAHAITPDVSQGASLALEDGFVLAAALRETRDTGAALRRYEDRRRKRAVAIARLSRQVGRIAQANRPLFCRLRDTAFRLTPGFISRRQFTRVVEYELPML